MTRFLKLVRHQNGSWQALPTETEEALDIPFFDNKNDDAPIDPAQLLKALDPLLFDDCGIKETSASQFSSLMKKFSKKLVSRCVYVNVLKVTKGDVLEKLLEQGGWSTINGWLTDAKETKNKFFLIKLLELCTLLPMTGGRLKQNNTIKLVKSLTKFDNESVQALSSELTAKWSTITDGETELEEVENFIEKIEKKHKVKVHKDHNKEHKKSGKKDSPIKKKKEEKSSNDSPKIKAKKRISSELTIELNNTEKAEFNGEPVPKKTKLSLSKSKKSPVQKCSPLNESHINEKVKPLLKSESKSTLKSELKSNVKSELKSNVKSELKPNVKSELKPNVKSELKPNLKSELKSTIKSETKPPLKPSSKPLKPGLKSESKSIQKTEAKSTLKSHSKNIPKSNLKTLKTEPKSPLKSKSKFDLFHDTSKNEKLNKVTNKKSPPSAIHDDVKIDIKPYQSPKKASERPKTVKSFKGKFRATGLEEAAPLPKKIPKKVSTVDKNAAAAAAKSAVVKRLNTTLPERITEKKIKPENLLHINEMPTPSGGIKLIPAKPRPIHTLQESGFFMDALDAARDVPVRRKKKPSPKTIVKPAMSAPPTPPTPTTPTSPPIKPPKLQFYKDTLETDEPPKEDKESKDTIKEEVTTEDTDESKSAENAKQTDEKTTEFDSKSSDNGSNDGSVKSETKSGDTDDLHVIDELEPLLPGGLRSILSHSRKNRVKKSVKWVDDDNLKQMHYFELDETERVNVLRKNFGDLKSIEAKRERELFEAAKRQAGDKMEEAIPWWTVPCFIKIPASLVEPGCFSQEKDTQNVHQQSVLQAIYFTRDSIPDSPQEPDSEHMIFQEPKIIPLDEENVLGSVNDHTSQKSKPVLPEILTSLISLGSSPMQMNHIEQPQTPPIMMQQPNSVSSNAPYDPAEPVVQVPANIPQHKPLQQMPINQPMFNPPQIPMMESEPRMPIPNSWNPMNPNMVIQDPQQIFQMNQLNMYPVNMGPFPINMPPPIPMPIGGGGGGVPPTSGVEMERDIDRRNTNNNNNNSHHKNDKNNNRRMQQRGRPMNHINQSSFPRQSGPRPRGVPRVPCRHFAMGGCRFGNSCTFLHPGVNGPR